MGIFKVFCRWCSRKTSHTTTARKGKNRKTTIKRCCQNCNKKHNKKTRI